MTTKKTITVGSLDEAAEAFIADVERLDRGELTDNIDTITFVSWPALAAVMTERRMELLRHLRQHPAGSIRGLARELGRDFKNVHNDLNALENAGLIVSTDGQWRVVTDEIQATIRLLPAA